MQVIIQEHFGDSGFDGLENRVWSSKAQVTYNFVVSRRRHGGDGLRILSDGSNLATKSSNDGNVYSVESPLLEYRPYLLKRPSQQLLLLQNTSRQHKQHFHGEPIPDLRSSAGKLRLGRYRYDHATMIFSWCK